jgi:hypothetical protein
MVSSILHPFCCCCYLFFRSGSHCFDSIDWVWHSSVVSWLLANMGSIWVFHIV